MKKIKLTQTGRPNYLPTEQDRRTVVTMIGGGIKQEKIAFALGISEKTLRKHFKEKLRVSSSYLDRLAMEGLAHHLENRDRAMIMFYLKTRCHWKENSPIEIPNPIPNFDIFLTDPTGKIIESEYQAIDNITKN